MEINKNTREIEGTLSNGTPFSLDIICRKENWLMGVNAPGMHFYTTSKDFETSGLIGVQIPMAILVDLRKLGVPDEDAKEMVEILSKFIG